MSREKGFLGGQTIVMETTSSERAKKKIVVRKMRALGIVLKCGRSSVSACVQMYMSVCVCVVLNGDWISDIARA